MEALAHCRLCPRNCGADRESGATGYCGADANLRIARIGLHHWEEPIISGNNGSGTIFFSGCNLRCVFCQNAPISHNGFGKNLSIEALAVKLLELESRGAHNINLVTAGHFAPQVAETIRQARSLGLAIPIVYNSSGYESLASFHLLKGLIDVYLPDLKFADPELSNRYAHAPDYPTVAQAAILEMVRQCGPVVLDERGLIRSGVVVRHLILPGAVADSKQCLQWMKQHLPKGVYVSLMAQYLPLSSLRLPPELNRKLTQTEYDAVLDELFSLGLEDGFVQELDSADEAYIPDFDLTGV
ncbi:radical SAM protein [Hydrogenispora ethanolica]|uniref:radical SAM protein n=1 Tax=Hydrogenispora ethanolica TaxID=1082276 RepID=UPI003C7186FF